MLNREKEREIIPSWKKLSLFAVTWPILVDSVLRMMLGTADVFMLSRISDEVAGAVGLANNSEIIALGATIFLLSIILEPGRVFNLVVINSLRAAGDARFPVLMGVISMWGVCVPLAYWLGVHLEMGLIGIWIAFTLDEWLRGLLMLYRWKSRAWVKKSLIRPGYMEG